MSLTYYLKSWKIRYPSFSLSISSYVFLLSGWLGDGSNWPYIFDFVNTFSVLLQELPRLRAENLEKNKVLFERICEIASRKGCSPSQLALAWVQHQGNDVVPIPGTTKVKNLEENIGALFVELTAVEMKELEDLVSSVGVFGDRFFDMDFTWLNSETPPLSSWEASV